MKVCSPITGFSHVVLEKEIPASFVIDLYQKQLHTNVRNYFQESRSLKIYRCLDTGYRFYYPFNLAGKSSFYKKLEKFPWYYMDWKWEHDIVKKLINNSDNVLEVGCGPGGFLLGISSHCHSAVGLETNQSAVRKGSKRGLKIFNESIQKFSQNHQKEYDLVCSFQVLEHVPRVRDFIKSSLETLKPGGKLIISVPNNDSFIIKTNDLALNYPPHHMGLWNLEALIKIQQIFNLRLDGFSLEPLQSYHVGFAHKMLRRSQNKLTKIVLDHYLPPVLERLREYIIGHTIMAVYLKI